MAEKSENNIIEMDFGCPNSEPQWKFFLSRVRYTCYGGARGGGKSWSIVRKAPLMALYYGGIQILIVRREYDQLENPIIQPMLKLLHPDIYDEYVTVSESRRFSIKAKAADEAA